MKTVKFEGYFSLKRVKFNLDSPKIMLTFLIKINCFTFLYTFFHQNHWNLLELHHRDQISHCLEKNKNFKLILRSI